MYVNALDSAFSDLARKADLFPDKSLYILLVLKLHVSNDFSIIDGCVLQIIIN